MSLELAYNKTKKTVSTSASKDALPEGVSYEDLEEQISQLNDLAQQFISLSGDVPQGPEPSKELSLQVKKCHEAGISSLKLAKFDQAIKNFTEGITISGKRNKWEAFQVTLFETQMCLMNRCDAYLLIGKYAEALQDADLLIKTTMSNNPDNYYRRSIAHLELGLLDNAKADLERGLAFQPGNEKLVKQLVVVKTKIDKENGDI